VVSAPKQLALPQFGSDGFFRISDVGQHVHQLRKLDLANIESLKLTRAKHMLACLAANQAGIDLKLFVYAFPLIDKNQVHIDYAKNDVVDKLVINPKITSLCDVSKRSNQCLPYFALGKRGGAV